MEINKKATGERLRRLLQERGMKAADLQRLLGLENHQAVYKWLGGKSLPSLGHLCQIAEILETSVEDILVYQKENHREEEES
ncbi:helix-turn-helix transcriptional regulator [Enterocloster aldenensis]|uniref:helix-turn-helix domain-containing protein n=1 Tax=Enterocloster aldenensis TaxID=358742 RepID=UPI0025A47671|nr:helix-turn-helix transcriptional regulator [Enterocloster aldenensis]